MPLLHVRKIKNQTRVYITYCYCTNNPTEFNKRNVPWEKSYLPKALVLIEFQNDIAGLLPYRTKIDKYQCILHKENA